MTSSTGIGKPVSRKDGFLKVTGGAKYAADMVRPGLLHAVFVTSTIPKGKIESIDRTATEKISGFIKVFTHENMAKFAYSKCFLIGGTLCQSVQPLQDDKIHYYGQVVAMVVAETLEKATHAAQLIKITYKELEKASASIHSTHNQKITPAQKVNPYYHPVIKGNAEQAIANAEAKVDLEYTTPIQHHNPMEPYCCTAEWSGDELTIYEPSQWVHGLKFSIAVQLGLSPEKVRVVSPFIGGGFGCKAVLMPHTSITVMAAKQLKRPVKLYISREQMYTNASFRGATKQRISIGANKTGNFQGVIAEQYGQTSREDFMLLNGTEITTRMYDFPNIKTGEFFINTDTSTPGFMRAPAEVPGMFAMESAIDELAYKLNMDPIELRFKNEPEKDPHTGLPFSSRSLVECYKKGAELFGWEKRSQIPGQMQDKDELIGYGTATAVYPTYVSCATVRMRLTMSGSVTIQTGSHDLGTGLYTVLAQIACEELGVSIDKVTVELGDTKFSPGALAGGSRSTASVGSNVKLACSRVREKLLKSLVAEDAPFTGNNSNDLVMKDERVFSPDGKSISLEKAFDFAKTTVIEEYTEYAAPGFGTKQLKSLLHGGGFEVVGPVIKNHVAFSLGAQFVEVRINKRTKTIRVSKMTGVFGCGKIINTKTARSQFLGGMVFGVGSALLEQTVIDDRKAQYINNNIAEYLLPVNADIPKITIEMLDEKDTIVNELGAKGVGEIGIVGVAAAIANAVYNATGIRVRDLPIRIENIL